MPFEQQIVVDHHSSQDQENPHNEIPVADPKKREAFKSFGNLIKTALSNSHPTEDEVSKIPETALQEPLDRREFLKTGGIAAAGAILTTASLAACESQEERLDRLIQHLKDSNPAIRVKAIKKLSAMNAEEILPATPALLEAVKDKNQVVQAYAIKALQEIVLAAGVSEDIAQGIPSLIEIAKTSNQPSLVRRTTIILLEDIGKQIDSQEFPSLREDIIIALVVTFLSDSNQHFAEQAMRTVRKLCAMHDGFYLIHIDKEPLNMLRRGLLEHPNNIVRANIAYILGKTDRIETFPELVQALNDSSGYVKETASRSLILLAQGFKVNFLGVPLPSDVMADLTNALNASNGIIYENLTKVLEILKD